MLNTRLINTLDDIIKTYDESKEPITKSQLMTTLNFIKSHLEQPTSVYPLIDDSSYETDYFIIVKNNQVNDADEIQRFVNDERKKWYEWEENDDLDSPYGVYGAWGNYITDALYDRYNADVITNFGNANAIYY